MTQSRMIKPAELPEWFRVLPAQSRISHTEFAKLMGVTASAIYGWEKLGKLPPAKAVPDRKFGLPQGRTGSNRGNQPPRFWSAAEIRAIIKDLPTAQSDST